MVWSCRWGWLVPMSWPSPWRTEASNVKMVGHRCLPPPFLWGLLRILGYSLWLVLWHLGLWKVTTDSVSPGHCPEERTCFPEKMATSCPDQEASRSSSPVQSLARGLLCFSAVFPGGLEDGGYYLPGSECRLPPRRKNQLTVLCSEPHIKTVDSCRFDPKESHISDINKNWYYTWFFWPINHWH